MASKLHTEDIAALKRGDVVLVRLGPAEGHEQNKTRPAVIVSADRFKNLATATIVPISTLKDRIPYVHEVELKKGEGGLKEHSVAQSVQVRTLDKYERVEEVFGSLSDERMKQISDKLKLVLGMVEDV